MSPFLLLALLVLLSFPSLHAQVFIDHTSLYQASLPPGTTTGALRSLTHPTSYSTDAPGSFNFSVRHHPGNARDEVQFSLPQGVALTPLNDPDVCDPSTSRVYPGLISFNKPFTVTDCAYSLSWQQPLTADLYVQYVGQALSAKAKATTPTRSSLTIYIHLVSTTAPPSLFPVLVDPTSGATYAAPVSGSTQVVGAFDTASAGSFEFSLNWSGDLTDEFELILDGAQWVSIDSATSSSSPACQVGGHSGHYTRLSLGYFSAVESCTYVVQYDEGDSGSLTVKVISRPSDGTMAYTGFLVYTFAVGNSNAVDTTTQGINN